MINFRIKEMMELRGVDSAQLGVALGRDSDYIRRLLMGVEPVTADDLVYISEWLDVPVWALMPDTTHAPGDKSDLLAYIEHKGVFYTADSIDSLKDIIKNLE